MITVLICVALWLFVAAVMRWERRER